MDLRPEPMTGRQRMLLTTKAEQASESGDAALTTAAILVVAIVVGLRLMHQSVVLTAVLAVPMLASGIGAYLFCRRRRRHLERDLQQGMVLTGSGRAALIRLEGRAAGSFLVRLPERKVVALNRGAGLRSLIVRPDPGTFSGSVSFAPHSGQLLGLSTASGRRLFDAHEQEIVDAYEEEFSKAS